MPHLTVHMTFPELQAFVAAAAAARTLGDLEALMADAAARLGFDHYALMHHVPLRDAKRPILRLTNYPQEWQERFISRAYVSDDPIFLVCQSRALSFVWSDVPQILTLTERQAAILAEATAHGILNGVSVPIHIPGEISGSCTLAATRSDAFARETLPIAHYVGCFAFEAGRRLLQARSNVVVALTQRQLDCLSLIARGKSDWETAQILGISETTVHQHVEAAKARYGVSTRIQLVVRALLDNTLSVADVA